MEFVYASGFNWVESTPSASSKPHPHPHTSKCVEELCLSVTVMTSPSEPIFAILAEVCKGRRWAVCPLAPGR